MFFLFSRSEGVSITFTGVKPLNTWKVKTFTVVKMSEIKLAIAGVGNCASSLVQGIHYYKNQEETNSKGINTIGVPGLMHADFAGYKISDIRPVAAFDVDKRKVGKDLSEALFAKPNCTAIFSEVPHLNVNVKMAPLYDGVADHMKNYPEERSFVIADEEPCDITEELKKSRADVLVNYLPVGSQKAVENLAEACLSAKVAMVNCMPVFIASDKSWASRFSAANIPIVGDDIKSEVGATIVHRVLTNLFKERGVILDRTYQLNFGGNSVTGDQEIHILIDGVPVVRQIGHLIDELIEKYGTIRFDGKEIVVGKKLPQKIECFTVDDKLKVKPVKVDAFIRHKINQNIYEIETEEGRTIRITGDHNIFVLNENGDLENIPVNKIKPNKTLIAVPKIIKLNIADKNYLDLSPYLQVIKAKGANGIVKFHENSPLHIPTKFPLSDEFLQIVGLWFADGNYDRKIDGNIEIACGDEPECLDVLERFLEPFNVDFVVRSSDGISVRIKSRVLARVMKNVFQLTGDAYTKRFPQWIFGLSDRQVSCVLRGYVSGDGGISGNQIRWTSVSKGLIDDIKTLFLRLGITSTVFKENYNPETKSGRYLSKLGYSYHGLITGKDDVNKFANSVRFLQNYKNESLNKIINRNANKTASYWIPNIASLRSKWKIKSSTWYRNPRIESKIVLDKINKINDPLFAQKIKNVCEGDVKFVKVRRVTPLNLGTVDVYDISTKPFERFICSNILVHNTDFLNMLERSRLKSKKISKTQSVQSQLAEPLAKDNIHIGPSDYVPFLNDRKICYIRMEGRKFGNVPIEIELRLSVEDSPNSAACVVDAVRACKVALDRKIGGPLIEASAWTMKSPPVQFTDAEAKQLLEAFISGKQEKINGESVLTPNGVGDNYALQEPAEISASER